MPTAHRLSFPTCLSHPRSIHLHCHQDSPLAANLPSLGLQQQTGTEVSELCGSYRTPSRSSHFLCALSHLERVAHRLGKLPLQQQSPRSHWPASHTAVNWENGYGHLKQKRLALKHITTLRLQDVLSFMARNTGCMT
jgi:hypothetical protein